MLTQLGSGIDCVTSGQANVRADAEVGCSFQACNHLTDCSDRSCDQFSWDLLYPLVPASRPTKRRRSNYLTFCAVEVAFAVGTTTQAACVQFQKSSSCVIMHSHDPYRMSGVPDHILELVFDHLRVSDCASCCCADRGLKALGEVLCLVKLCVRSCQVPLRMLMWPAQRSASSSAQSCS